MCPLAAVAAALLLLADAGARVSPSAAVAAARCRHALRRSGPNISTASALGARCATPGEGLGQLWVESLDRVVAGLYAARGYRFERARVGRLVGLKTGGSICAGDVELFARLCQVFRPRRIFGVGNAFGYSSLALSYACGNAPLDVIDAENEFAELGGERLAGAETRQGTLLTRRIAAEEHRDVHVHVGFSPEQTAEALRGSNGSYDLAFIDGKHTKRAMVADFLGIRRNMAPAAVVVFHDVGVYHLWRAVSDVLRTQRVSQPAVQYRTFEGQWYKNEFGTGFASWGFAEGTFEGFGPLFTGL